MGGSTSKAATATARTGSAAASASHLPGDDGDSALKNFKPTKVVEMSRSEAKAAVANMYDQVPEMDPEILKQLIKLGPAVKTELTHQKLLPDESERVKVTTPRPLPKSRARVVISNKEVSSDIGVLTQTQAVELLTVREKESTVELARTLAEGFGVAVEDVQVLLKYYRTPNPRKVKDEVSARWHWPEEREGDPVVAGSNR